MSLQVNLLPWRDDKRRALTRKFFAKLALGFFLSLGAAEGIMIWMQGRYITQNQRNLLLNREIATLQVNLGEIDELDERKNQLLERMALIQDLQVTRNRLTHTLRALAASTPEGVALQQFTHLPERSTIIGYSDAERSIADFMGALHQPIWAGRAKLEEIRLDQAERRRFILHIERQSDS